MTGWMAVYLGPDISSTDNDHLFLHRPSTF